MSHGLCVLRSALKPQFSCVPSIYNVQVQQRRGKAQKKKVYKVVYSKRMRARIPKNWRDVNYNPANIPSAWKPDNWMKENMVDYEREEELAKYIPGYNKKIPLEMQENYQENPAFLIDDQTEMSGGLKQSLFITKSILAGPGLPSNVMERMEEHPIDTQEYTQDERVKQTLRHALLFDIDPRSLDKEAKVKMYKQESYQIYSKPDRYVPLIMKNLIRMCDAKLSHVSDSFGDRMSVEQLPSNATFKRVCDTFENKLLPGIDTEWNVSINSKPDIQVLTKKPLPMFANQDEVKSTSNTLLPNLYPILPVINLKKSHLYNPELTTGLYDNFPRPYLHTVVLYNINGVGASEMYAKMNQTLFTALFTRAQDIYGPDAEVLSEPLTGQCIASNGQSFQFMCMQLNTMDLSNDNGVKNMVWVDDENPDDFLDAVDEVPASSMMYEECSHATWWSPEYITAYNENVFKLFKAIWLNNVAK
uniref:Large ribosomal subunit protein mL37 n=1 Tax=Ciona intestinalis TaxID=7719 RepID=F6Z589_CIOIN|nr:39S ribosomal protein L37, mitochondrial [Ciona intestinalis]|eukprot:XP_002127665.1 39S ribosomal protein L37, mitochondrial [Ciona intestinalis]